MRMKNLVSFVFAIVVFSGCQKKDDIPVMNQLSFTMGSEMFDCYDRFYWDEVSYFSVHFQSEVFGKGIISIETSHINEVGDYIIDSFTPNLSDVITISGEGVGGFYSTFQGIWNPCQGSGRITIHEVSPRYIKGSFEGILIGSGCQDSLVILDGAFQIRRD